MNDGIDRRDTSKRWTPEEIRAAQRAVADEELARQIRDQKLEKWATVGCALLVMLALVGVLCLMIHLSSTHRGF